MKIVEREYWSLQIGNQSRLGEVAQRGTRFEERKGVPDNKYYHPFGSGQSSYTLVAEREYDSFTEMEEAYARQHGDKEMKKIGPEWPSLRIRGSSV